MTRRRQHTTPVSPLLDGWPGWAGFAALGGMWLAGLLAALLSAIAFLGAGALAAKLAGAVIATAGTAGVLVWLASLTGRVAADRFGIRPVDPARAVPFTAFVAAVLALACGVIALLGGFDGLRVPRELSVLDAPAWAAGLPEPVVPFDAGAAAAILARAVLGVTLLELVVRGVVLPSLARLVGPWPAIGVTALLGAVSFGAIAGDGKLLLPALVLGLLLGPLAVATGSMVPGTALGSAFAGVALAGACGWDPVSSVLAGAGCAVLVAGVLLALAGDAARPAGEPLPAASVGRFAAERGQIGAEFMGMMLLVALVCSALVLIGMQTQISNQVELLICRIAGGDCTAQQAAVDKDCIVASSTSKGSAAVTVAVVKVGEESTMIKTVYADGRTVFTLVKNATVAGELIAGAKAKAGKIGFDASASASAGGKLEGAMVYTFTDPEKAKEFEDQVRKHGSFGQVVRDSVEGFDPFGVKDWVLDHTVGEDVDAGDLPTPDATYVSIDALIKGEAKAMGNVVIADAGAKGLLQAAGGAKVYTSGENKGKIELNIKIDAEAAANLGLLTFGPEINGKANFIATVTLDDENGYRPSHMKVTATAGYNGDLRDADLVLKPTEGQIDQIQKALKAGNLKSAAFGSTDGSGQQVEFTADMDLTDPAAQADALGLFTGDATSAANLVARMNEDGRLTFQTYDTTSSSTEAGVRAGIGVGGAVEGSQTRDDRNLGNAWVREPGAGWTVRNCGLGG